MPLKSSREEGKTRGVPSPLPLPPGEGKPPLSARARGERIRVRGVTLYLLVFEPRT
jgi:hypothetical protein